MPWFRLVEWLQCVACSYPAAIQRHRSRDFGKVETHVSSRRHRYLHPGVWLSVLYLQRQNTKDLAPHGMRDARHDRSYDGNVSFFAGYDRPQPGGVRAGFASGAAPSDPSAPRNSWCVGCKRIHGCQVASDRGSSIIPKM